MGTQGCGGAVPSASACAPCHRQKWNLAGWGRVAFGCDTELELSREFPPCFGFLCNIKESLLVSVPCFSNRVMRVALPHVFICLFY